MRAIEFMENNAVCGTGCFIDPLSHLIRGMNGPLHILPTPFYEEGTRSHYPGDIRHFADQAHAFGMVGDTMPNPGSLSESGEIPAQDSGLDTTIERRGHQSKPAPTR